VSPLIKKFLEYCRTNKYHQNKEQVAALKLLIKFFKQNFISNIFNILFFKKNNKLGFYLYGEVGVGKTMLIDFLFNNLKTPKLRMHFNEFMIYFHDFRHSNKFNKKGNSIDGFVNEIKNKAKLIYLDEFQVTNIVDAMILGKLFKILFKENLKIIITTNIKLDDLYKDGLQRDQFIPFINIIKKFSIQHELNIKLDYRKLERNKLERFFFPVNDRTSFQLSQIFRQLTKDKIFTPTEILVKGRKFKINFFFEGVVRFHFNDLCGINLGAEDYIAITDICSFIAINNVPNFNEDNSDKQQRFITLIDIIYEKKIPILINANFNHNNFSTSKRLTVPFKRTVSRLYELTSFKYF
jgi:cell division protein ZapE|tara:strand:- start:109 stop:1164 length:1056 start_codon:yes stop_codon:yes gene_type:complete